MDQFWKDLTEDDANWSIRTYNSGSRADYELRAGVIAFGDRAILCADGKLLDLAGKGQWMANFVLAHEAAHVGLGHYERSAVVKNFQLFSGRNGLMNLPPTVEELEANYGAAFLQCGTALFDESMSALELARRASSDVRYVEKAQRILRLEPFRRELWRQSRSKGRVIL